MEIAEVEVNHLKVDGSLQISATHPLGHFEGDFLRYSSGSGKCTLNNVFVKNRGIRRDLPQIYWKNQLIREESCHIILHGNAEFYAENVTLQGDLVISVPPGERWRAFSNKNGEVEFEKEEIRTASWQWVYQQREEEIILLRQEVDRKEEGVELAFDGSRKLF